MLSCENILLKIRTRRRVSLGVWELTWKVFMEFESKLSKYFENVSKVFECLRSEGSHLQVWGLWGLVGGSVYGKMFIKRFNFS